MSIGRPFLIPLLGILALAPAACHDGGGDGGAGGPTFFLTVYPDAAPDGALEGCAGCAAVPLDLWIDGWYAGGLTEPTTFALPFTGLEYEIVGGSSGFRFLYRDFAEGEYSGILAVVRCGCGEEGGDCSRVLSMQSAYRFKTVPCDAPR